MSQPTFDRPSQLDALAPFNSTLRGKGRQMASPMGPEHEFSGTFSAQWELDKRWLAYSWQEGRTQAHPMPMNGLGFLGYDAAAEKYVGVWVDGLGEKMNGTSPGWQDDTWVWTWDGGAMMGQPMHVRGTWSRRGAKVVSAVWEVNIGGQGWNRTMEVTFDS